VNPTGKKRWVRGPNNQEGDKEGPNQYNICIVYWSVLHKIRKSNIEIWNKFEHLNLFRISCFGFRIYLFVCWMKLNNWKNCWKTKRIF
jgi:hypothetical protein